MTRSLLLMVVVLMLGGCGDSTPLSVENDSGVLLESLVVSGSGFEQRLGDLAANAVVKTHVKPRGESGVGISFRARGKTIFLPPRGYFEGGGGYAVAVVVTPSLTASVDSQLRSY